VFDIDREHPEYAANKRVWAKYRDLYVGGEQFQRNAQEYLIRRQREPGDVYTERLSRVFYENYIGSIVDWYAATLFRRDPQISMEGRNEGGKRFFAALSEDSDRKGTTLTEFFRRTVSRDSDHRGKLHAGGFSRVRSAGGNRAEEDASGRRGRTW
jgi:hypothetical protein